MLDLEERVARAGAEIDPGWDDAHVQAALAVLYRRRRQRRTMGAALAAVVLGVGLFGGWLLRGQPRVQGNAPPPGATGGSARATGDQGGVGASGAAQGGGGDALGAGVAAVAGHDAAVPGVVGGAGLAAGAGMGAGSPDAPVDPNGWSAAPADEKSSITLAAESPSEVLLALRGSGRFQVDPRSGRTIRIEVMEMSVVLRSGRIVVEQRGERVWLSVREGSARVEWERESRTLAAGEEEWFPPAPAHAAAGTQAAAAPAMPAAAGTGVEAPVEASATPAAGEAAAAAPEVVATGWRALARRGGFDEAFAALSSAEDPVRDEAEDLLLAADTARLSGHPAAALPYLDRVLDDHTDDPRAPVAAFSKGRILLELARPGDAAQAFRLTRGLAPEGALAEDALAREVESLAGAGLAERAHAAASEYVRKYPTGAWLRSVRRHGGL